MTEGTAKIAARSIAAATLFLTATALALSVGDRYTKAEDIPSIVAVVLGMGALAVIGMIVATRAPSSPIGWLFGAVALLVTLSIGASQYAIRGLTDFDFPMIPAAVLINAAAAIPAFVALIMAYLLFPDGRLPGRRWRIVAVLLVISGVLVIVGTLFGEENLSVEDLSTPNPLAMGPDELWRVALTVGAWGMFAAGVLALVSIIVRTRRSRGEERQQLRWLAGAAALIMVALLAVFVTGSIDEGSTANNVAFVVLILAVLLGLPLATAIAVLRYRLYDLDLVIKKTVIFGITVMLVMAAFIGVLLMVSGPLTDIAPDETLAVFVAALAIGILISPLWRLARRIGDRVVYGGRVTPSEALSEFRERLSETYATDDVLPRMAAILGSTARASEARVWLRVAGELRQEGSWPSDLERMPAVAIAGEGLPRFPGVDHAVEIRDTGELLGALTTAFPANDPIDDSRDRLVRDLASQAGLVLRNVRLIEELRASRQRLVAAQDAERRRLERNIHDGAQQQLVALGVKLRLADSLIDRDPVKGHEMLAQLQIETQAAIDDLRDLARGIYPPLLADRGLGAALEAQARKSATPVDIEADGLGRFEQDVEAAIYFSCLEALQNVAKYAGASRATILLEHRNGSVEFSVSDDGGGFDPALVVRGTGLQSMTDRIDAIGGSLKVESAPGRGTVVRGHVPIV
jgi:signal transduction histidine kinase